MKPKTKLLLNISFNLFTAILFAYLNTWALGQGLEETFVTLAIFYGLITITFNALFLIR